MKRIAALLFLSLSVLPFLILKDTWVTTTHIGTTDIFAQDGSFNDANNILGQTGLIENTGSSKFRFELFERIVNDVFAIGKAALLVLRNCNDDKPSTNDLTAKECEILDSEIRRIRLLEPVNEEYEIGASFISGLKSTASRTKKFIEIRVSNEDKDISFVILKSVLIGIDSQLKDVSLVSNYKELEALENALDENISLEQREFLFKEMTKVLIGIQKAKTDGTYSHTVLIEPYSYKVSSLIIKILFFIFFLTLSLVSIYFDKLLKVLGPYLYSE